MAGKAGLFVARDTGGNGTTPVGARQALAGLLAKNADGTVRVGVLADGLGPVVTGAAGMSYSVRKHVAVVKVSEANGPVLVPNDGALSLTTDPAPGSNSRIDVIWVRQHHVTGDGGSDTDVTPEYGVAKGASSASPSKPAIPTGATELASVPVVAGTTATSGLTFTQGPLTYATGTPTFQVLAKRWGVDFDPSKHTPKTLAWPTSVSTSAGGIAAIVANLSTYFAGVASVQITGSAVDGLRSAKGIIDTNRLDAYCYGMDGTGVVSAVVDLNVTITGWI